MVTLFGRNSGQLAVVCPVVALLRSMVKVNVISRSKLEWTKDRAGEVPRAHRSYDDKQATALAKQTEYARAVRAAKLDRMFAKPFLGAMGGHNDTVEAMALDSTNVAVLATGAADGEVIMWNAMTKKARRTIAAHRNAIGGLCFTPDGVGLLTASRDRVVKLWETAFADDGTPDAAPLAEYLGDSPFSAVDHNWHDATFATAGHELQLWDVNRTRPIQQFTWGDDTLTSVRFNKTETHLAAVCGMDRGVCVYDTRAKTGHSKLIVAMTCNSVAWNPMDPNMFVAACDDWNCYMFDLRITARPRGIYQGPLKAVTSVDFSPTGRTFCAGAADQTVRWWNVDQTVKSDSAEMYHTKRMARVQAVRWSLDNNFIFSGSEDAVVRVWKADASAPIRGFRGSEKSQFNYMRSLKERYRNLPEVRRISNQRNTPKAIKQLRQQKRSTATREMVKEMSRRKTTDIKPLARKKTVQALK